MKETSCCKHNKMIECAGDFRPCYNCGWNPEVHEKRLQKVAAKASKPSGISS